MADLSSALGSASAPDIEQVYAAAAAEQALPPETPSLTPRQWLQRNLFSSFGSGLMTILGIWVVLLIGRGLLQFAFSEQRDWASVRFNLRLLFTQAYPSEQYARVWVAVGVVMVLAGLSLGLARRQSKVSAKRLAAALMTSGALVAVGIVLREPSVVLDAEGKAILADLADGADPGGGAGLYGTVAILAGLAAVVVRLLTAQARSSFGVTHAATDRVDRLAAAVGAVAGGLWLVLFMLGPWALRPDIESPLRESFADAMADRAVWWLIAVILCGSGAAIWFGLGDQLRRSTRIAGVYVFFGASGLLVLSGWLVPWGSYTFGADGFVAQPDSTVSATTKGPWSVMWLLLAAAYATGRFAARQPLSKTLRPALGLLWVLSPFGLYWVVLRDPMIDWDHVYSTDLPMAIAFGLAGAVVLFLLTRVGIGELGRGIAVALVMLAIFNWVAAFAGWYPMLQKARISFALLALFAVAAPNFASEERRQRMRLVWAWLAVTAVLHYLVTLVNSPSTVETPSEGFLGGFGVTVFVAVFTLICSFPLGVLLALGRTSKMPIFRVLCTAFIESVRGIPLITILFFMANILPLFLPEGMDIGNLAAVTVGFILFSAAYLAENVRGGLQAVRRGQYEAADALGLNNGQRTSFIVLPQGLRVSIPPLVGQTIATFKETSLLSIIGVFDILFIANRAIPAQSEFLGSKREALLFISIVYWVFAYSMSKYSQSLERRLGVGER